MTDLCPCCHQPLPGDPVETEAENIRQWCRENSVKILADHLLRLDGAAEVLGCTVSTVNRKISAGQLQPKIITGRRYIELEEIAKLICENSKYSRAK